MTTQTFVPVLTVMVDYGNAPFLWLVDSPDQNGVGPNICDGSFWDESFPMSEGLWQKFTDWAIEFDKTRFDSVGFSEGWDWYSYHQRGFDLARWLKEEVGERYRVVYKKPYEDVDCQNEVGVEVQLAHALPRLRSQKHPAYRPKNLLTKEEVESLLKDAKKAHIKSRKILGYD